VIPYGGTFLIFSDYCRPAIRLSALQQARVIYRDDPRFDRARRGRPDPPADRAAAGLRAIPNLAVFRPADAVETAECWSLALRRTEGPSLLALSRQNLPQLRKERSAENLCARGAYTLREAKAERRVVLIGTGSEVHVALEVADALEAQGIGADVVSMPCWSLFDGEDPIYRGDVLPGGALLVSIEAAATLGWERYTGRYGLNIGLDRFGASAPAGDLFSASASPPRRSCRTSCRRSNNPKEIKNMATRVAINGFGRIGRLVARAILQKPESGLELVAINDLADAESNALLFKRDSVHGAWPGEVRADGNDLIVDGRRIKVTAERDPAKLPHGADGIALALECTGFFTDRDKAGAHLAAGARKVLISAPAKGVDLTVVYGVNHDKLPPSMRSSPTPPARPTAWRRSPR
jgi:hypothetical protein